MKLLILLWFRAQFGLLCDELREMRANARAALTASLAAFGGGGGAGSIPERRSSAIMISRGEGEDGDIGGEGDGGSEMAACSPSSMMAAEVPEDFLDPITAVIMTDPVRLKPSLHDNALPCPVLPCPVLPCPALPCPALPCPALPCPPHCR